MQQTVTSSQTGSMQHRSAVVSTSSMTGMPMEGGAATAVSGEPPPPRIMTSSPGGYAMGPPVYSSIATGGPLGPAPGPAPGGGASGFGGGASGETTIVPTNSRAATLSALGSSIGSSGGGMSDSGFAASTSSGFGPGSSTGSTTGVHVGPNKPDLSHLTPEERAIIENVIHRQQTEESKEFEFLR